MKHADTEQDNSTVEKYLKGLRRSRDPASAMVYGFFKAAILNGFCQLDDEVDVAQEKIEKALTKQRPAG